MKSEVFELIKRGIIDYLNENNISSKLIESGKVKHVHPESMLSMDQLGLELLGNEDSEHCFVKWTVPLRFERNSEIVLNSPFYCISGICKINYSIRYDVVTGEPRLHEFQVMDEFDYSFDRV